MAASPAHKWGQIIGSFLEEALLMELSRFARKHKLYLDKKGRRPARPGLKVSWFDSFDNIHDLDFVLERDGTAHKIGEPVAFIESAWRRYTKHSRNKAQEIQGAILPLVATHKNFAPFIGVMLAGEFTEGAITQLKSIGFNVLYFPYSLIVKGFAEFGLDAASEEDTPDEAFQAKISSWEQFEGKDKLARHLFSLNRPETMAFFGELEKAVSRYVVSVGIILLHGQSSTLDSISQAINYIKAYDGNGAGLPVLKYEILIKYSNGDKVEGSFQDDASALAFLDSYEAPRPKKT